MTRSAEIRGCTARGALLVTTLILAAGVSPAGAGDPAGGEAPRPRLGFFAGSREAERKAETETLTTPTPEKERAWPRAPTEAPPGAGTPQGKKAAEYVRDRR